LMPFVGSSLADLSRLAEFFGDRVQQLGGVEGLKIVRGSHGKES